MKHDSDSILGATGQVRRTILGTLGAALAAPGLLSSPARAAQAWPNRPVRFILGFSAGGATDTLSRLYCQKMSELTGQEFIVDNRTGAGGQVGMSTIARAAPDGYTVGMANISNNATAPALYKSLPYHPADDFAFSSGLWQLPNLLVVNPGMGVNTLPELIELLRNNPGKYSFGSSGAGTTVHLSGELFKHLAKVDILHVPYRGGRPALLDLIAGRIHMLFDNMPGSLPFAQDGSVKALGVTTSQRNQAAPEIPAVAEALPGYEIVSWTAVAAPAGTPKEVVERLSQLSGDALRSPDLAKRFNDLGATPWPTSSSEITAYRNAEEARLTPVIKAAGIVLE